MITTHHEQVLARLERRALAEGPALEQVDFRVAEQLHVPVDYYLAYLLVWGAIEAYRLAHTDHESTDPSPGDGDAAAAIAQIGWHASRTYAASVRCCCDHATAVGGHASAILEQVLHLNRHLPATTPSRAPQPAAAACTVGGEAR